MNRRSFLAAVIGSLFPAALTAKASHGSEPVTLTTRSEPKVTRATLDMTHPESWAANGLQGGVVTFVGGESDGEPISLGFDPIYRVEPSVSDSYRIQTSGNGHLRWRRIRSNTGSVMFVGGQSAQLQTGWTTRRTSAN